MGNNYESAIITAQNALKKYPSNAYREEFSMIILESKYQEALLSVENKRIERYRMTIDEYYNFINEFPDGKLKKKAEKIFSMSQNQIKE
jgi:outer membrane protein assembly factor BamD